MNFSLEINSTVISTVVANDKAVSKLKGVNSKNTDAINKTKLQTIAHLSAALADESRFPRNKKGKTVFGKNVASGIKLQLSDAGIKDATAKELSELSQFLIRHLSINGNNNAADILAWFADEGITSQAKLKALANGDADKSDFEKLLDKAIGRQNVKTGRWSDASAVLESKAELEAWYQEAVVRLENIHQQKEDEARLAEEKAKADEVISDLTS